MKLRLVVFFGVIGVASITTLLFPLPGRAEKVLEGDKQPQEIPECNTMLRSGTLEGNCHLHVIAGSSSHAFEQASMWLKEEPGWCQIVKGKLASAPLFAPINQGIVNVSQLKGRRYFLVPIACQKT